MAIDLLRIHDWVVRNPSAAALREFRAWCDCLGLTMKGKQTLRVDVSPPAAEETSGWEQDDAIAERRDAARVRRETDALRARLLEEDRQREERLDQIMNEPSTGVSCG